MSSRTQDPQSQFIPLSKLKKSPRNVRQTPHGKAHIEALADSIQAHGQIQNLVVETEVDEDGRKTGSYLVTAGEGRRLAQLARVQRKHIKVDEPIRCVIDDSHNARAVSLAENELHQKLGAADQLVAFKQLVDGGQSVEEVAAHFGVTPLVVQRRLKLANVAPDFIALYRKQEIDLSQLMALAICDDHEKQKHVWTNLPKYDRHPESLRRALTENEISVREPIVKFVGLKAYEKAGGFVRHDLFAEKQADGFVTDPELLRDLAAEKLKKAAARLADEGHAWVEVIAQLDYATLSTFGRVQSILRDATPKERAKLDALNQKLAEVEQQVTAAEDDEDRFSALSDKADEIAAEIEALEEKRQVSDPEQQALSGAIVSIGRSGDLEVNRGLLRPEDAKRFAREDKGAITSASPSGPRVHSAALMRRLTANKTLALQVTLARRPAVALSALTHRLVLRTFFNSSHRVPDVVQIETKKTALGEYASDIRGCKAQVALAELGETLRSGLPTDPAILFAWLLEQPTAEVLQLCAYCVAITVNGVSDDENDHSLDALADAAGLDMRDWFAPNADNYLGSVPKARILEVVREAVSPEAAATLAQLKKAALIQEAEKRLAGTGWLPSPLRGQVA
jgi:ParB family chromosome partitioning protein